MDFQQQSIQQQHAQAHQLFNETQLRNHNRASTSADIMAQARRMQEEHATRVAAMQASHAKAVAQMEQRHRENIAAQHARRAARNLHIDAFEQQFNSLSNVQSLDDVRRYFGD